jgi:L-lactate dehydrogenase complex protein LldG
MIVTSGAKADILAAIGRAVSRTGGGREADYASISRRYIREGLLDETERVALFVDRLEHYNVAVHRTTVAGLPDTIASACRTRGKRRLIVPNGLAAAVLPRELEFVADEGLSYEELDRCEGVATMSTVGIATSGTIVLTHNETEGRRALTLIPDYHLCMVRADQIVATVPEAFKRLAALAAPLVTTISGPSATADIEMIRVKGVHGPRTLEVIVVGREGRRDQ